MFTQIDEYMKKSRDERRAHLKLEEPCIEIGGCSSVQYRGLLAHSLMTTIPTRQRIFVCHACNKAGCSNPRHLYWGTPMDNHLDQVEAGTFKSFPRSLEKMQKQGQTLGQTFGKLNGGKNALTADQLTNIKAVIDAIPKKWGWVAEAAKQLDVSHTQVRRYVKML
jgi:hypothetical protein